MRGRNIIPWSVPAVRIIFSLVFLASALFLCLKLSPRLPEILWFGAMSVEISGVAGDVCCPGVSPSAISSQPIRFPARCLLKLHGRESCARVAFSSGDIMEVRGTGDVELSGEKCSISSARIVSRFEAKRRRAVVVVPWAVLETGSATVLFDLTSGLGTVALLDGTVDITFTQTNDVIRWKQGEVLKISTDDARMASVIPAERKALSPVKVRPSPGDVLRLHPPSHD